LSPPKVIEKARARSPCAGRVVAVCANATDAQAAATSKLANVSNCFLGMEVETSRVKDFSAPLHAARRREFQKFAGTE
jgi:hypothetical protein